MNASAVPSAIAFAVQIAVSLLLAIVGLVLLLLLKGRHRIFLSVCFVLLLASSLLITLGFAPIDGEVKFVLIFIVAYVLSAGVMFGFVFFAAMQFSKHSSDTGAR